MRFLFIYDIFQTCKQMQKDMYFYSTYCDHCRSITDLIIKQGLRNSYMFVCVDNKALKIPPFITHVPSILSYQTKSVYVDDALLTYINRMSSSEEISPFSMMNEKAFTYLTEDGYDDGNVVNQDMVQRYEHVNRIGNIQQAHVEIPSEKNSKFDSSTFDRFLSNRKNDDENIKKLLGQQ